MKYVAKGFLRIFFSLACSDNAANHVYKHDNPKYLCQNPDVSKACRNPSHNKKDVQSQSLTKVKHGQWIPEIAYVRSEECVYPSEGKNICGNRHVF